MRSSPGPRANPAPVLCVYSPARRGCRCACFSEDCWTYCQGRIPVWFLSLDRCRLENAIAELLWGCFPLSLALECVCVCARARVVGCNGENFCSWARVWTERGRESRFQTLVKIACDVNLLEDKLEKSREYQCPVCRRSVFAFLEPMCAYLEL